MPLHMPFVLATEFNRLLEAASEDEKAENFDAAIEKSSKVIKLAEKYQLAERYRYYRMRAELNKKINKMDECHTDEAMAEELEETLKIYNFTVNSWSPSPEDLVNYPQAQAEQDALQASGMAYKAYKKYSEQKYEEALEIAHSSVKVFWVLQANIVMCRALIKLDKPEVVIKGINALLQRQKCIDINEVFKYRGMAQALLGNCREARNDFLYEIASGLQKPDIKPDESEEFVRVWQQNEEKFHKQALKSLSGPAQSKLLPPGETEEKQGKTEELALAQSLVLPSNGNPRSRQEKLAMLTKNQPGDIASIRIQIIEANQNRKCDSLLYYQLGHALHEQGKLEEAVKEYTLAIYLCHTLGLDQENNTFVLFYLQKRRIAYLQLGEFEKALDDFSAITKRIEESKAIYRMGPVSEAVRNKLIEDDDRLFVKQCIYHAPKENLLKRLRIYGEALKMLGYVFPANPHFMFKDKFAGYQNRDASLAEQQEMVKLFIISFKRGLSILPPDDLEFFASTIEFLRTERERTVVVGPASLETDNKKDRRKKNKNKLKPKPMTSSKPANFFKEAPDPEDVEKNSGEKNSFKDKKKEEEDKKDKQDKKKGKSAPSAEGLKELEKERAEKEKTRIAQVKKQLEDKAKNRAEAKALMLQLAEKERQEKEAKAVEKAKAKSEGEAKLNAQRVNKEQAGKAEAREAARKAELVLIRTTAQNIKPQLLSVEEIRANSAWFTSSPLLLFDGKAPAESKIVSASVSSTASIIASVSTLSVASSSSSSSSANNAGPDGSTSASSDPGPSANSKSVNTSTTASSSPTSSLSDNVSPPVSTSSSSEPAANASSVTPNNVDSLQQPTAKKQEIQLTPSEISYLQRLLDQQLLQRNLRPEETIDLIYGDIPRRRFGGIYIPSGLSLMTDATEQEVLAAFNPQEFHLVSSELFYYGQRFLIQSLQTGGRFTVVRGEALIKLNSTPENRLLAQAQLLPYTIEGLFADIHGKISTPLPETLDDLKNRNLRAVLHPWALFDKDPACILQSLYYVDQLGKDLPLDFKNAAIEFAPRMLAKNELYANLTSWVAKLFNSPNAVSNFDLLCDLGILDGLFPLMAASLIADRKWIREELSEPGLNQNYALMVLLVSVASQNLLFGQTIPQAVQVFLQTNPIMKINFDGFVANEKFGPEAFYGLLATVIQKWQASHPVLQKVFLPFPFIPGNMNINASFFPGSNFGFPVSSTVENWSPQQEDLKGAENVR